MMPKGSLKIVPGVAEVRFLPVVEPADYASREELMVAVRGAMSRRWRSERLFQEGVVALSPIRRCRMASASFLLAKGPT